VTRAPSDTTPRRQSAVLFGRASAGAGYEQPLDELAGLAEAAGLEVVGRLTQRLDSPRPATYLGKGKVGELQALARARHADVVLADVDLSPAQARNLSRALGVRVVDRSELIMDIFAGRARTTQAKVQVELAQLQYALPRLRGEWTHLDRLRGGGVGTRGPGEKQLETDRRLVRRRIGDLQAQLETFERRTRLSLHGRRFARQVALAGYTNSGKSTLFNRLTGSERLAADRLFATLDTRTRRWEVPGLGETVLSDTVGFIRELPHHLVASFHATLEEVVEADLVLHVVDGAHPQAREHVESVQEVMESIGAGSIAQIVVINKIDAVTDAMDLQALRNACPGSVCISARTGEGLRALEDAVRGFFQRGTRHYELAIPVVEGRALSRVRELAEVVASRTDDDHVHHLLAVGPQAAGRLRAWADQAGLELRAAEGDGAVHNGRRSA